MRPQFERLVARATDDVALRAELSGALMDARFDALQRALEAALGRADECLYEAKRTGKNRTCSA